MKHYQIITKLLSRENMLLRRQFSMLRRYTTPALSSGAAELPPILHCDKDLTEINQEDYLKMYFFGEKDFRGVLSAALPRKYLDLCNTLHSNGFLIRKPALDVIDTIKESSLNPPPKILLYGPDGGGKSLSLLQVLNHCILKEWVVLYVPNAFRFIDSQGSTQVQHSSWNSQRVDQPEESISWLNIFRSMNLKFLTQAKTTQEYKWGKRELTDKDRPLLEVLEQGVGRNQYANDAVGVILKEIRQNKEIKVLYAVDAFNGLFGSTSHKLDGKLVDINSLSLIHHFTKLLKPEYSFAAGAFVMATSRTVQFLKHSRPEEHPRFLDNLLDQSVLSRLGDFTDIEVPNYNEVEFLTILNYYSEKGWLAKDLNQQLVNEIRFMTNRNPTLVRKILSSL